MHEDGAVVEALRRGDVEVGHIAAVQLALILLHLFPLVVGTVGGMDPSKGFHGEKKDQLEMRRMAAGEGSASLQGMDEGFAWGHDLWVVVVGHVCLARERAPFQPQCSSRARELAMR